MSESKKDADQSTSPPITSTLDADQSTSPPSASKVVADQSTFPPSTSGSPAAASPFSFRTQPINAAGSTSPVSRLPTSTFTFSTSVGSLSSTPDGQCRGCIGRQLQFDDERAKLRLKANETINVLVKELEDLAEICNIRGDQLAKVNGDFAAFKSDHIDCEDSEVVAEYIEEIEKLGKERDDLKECYNEQRSDMKRVTEENTSLREELEELKRENNILKEDVATTTAHLNEVEERSEQNKAVFDNLLRVKQALEDKMEQMKGKFEEVQDDYEDDLQKFREREGENGTLADQLQKLRTQLRTEQDARAAAEMELAKTKTSLAAKSVKYQSQELRNSITESSEEDVISNLQEMLGGGKTSSADHQKHENISDKLAEGGGFEPKISAVTAQMSELVTNDGNEVEDDNKSNSQDFDKEINVHDFL